MQQRFSNNKQRLLLLFAIAALAALPFLHNLFDGYLSDDWVLATYAAHSTQSFFSLFATNNLGGISGGAYRPLFAIFWEIGHFLGDTPFPLHLIQLLFHIGTALLIVWLGKEICGETYKKVGVVAALFFVVFPNHAEAVIWLATSADPIGTFFYFLALAYYLHARQQEKNVLFWFAGAWIAALLAFFSKEMMVTLPAILLLWECLHVKRTQIKKDVVCAVLFLSPFFLLCGAYLFLRWQATGLVFGYYAAPKLSIDPVVAIRSTVTMTLSHFLSSDFRTYWSPTLNYQNILTAMIVVMGTIALIIRRWIRPSPTLLFLVGAYILSLGPVVQFGINTIPGRITDEGERYVYLPSVFFALLLSWIVIALRERLSATRRKILAVIVVIFYIFLATQLVIKTERWHQAAKTAAAILTTWHEQYASAPADGVIVIGLPDNTQGIYLWRNGFTEAIAAQFGIHPDMIITPIRTIADSNNTFSLTSVPKRYLYQAVRGDDIVGDPIFEGADYTSALLDPIDAQYSLSYRYFSHEATLHFSQAFLQTNAGRTIAIMAWDGNGWQRVDVKP